MHSMPDGDRLWSPPSGLTSFTGSINKTPGRGWQSQGLLALASTGLTHTPRMKPSGPRHPSLCSWGGSLTIPQDLQGLFFSHPKSQSLVSCLIHAMHALCPSRLMGPACSRLGGSALSFTSAELILLVWCAHKGGEINVSTHLH